LADRLLTAPTATGGLVGRLVGAVLVPRQGSRGRAVDLGDRAAAAARAQNVDLDVLVLGVVLRRRGGRVGGLVVLRRLVDHLLASAATGGLVGRLARVVAVAGGGERCRRVDLRDRAGVAPRAQHVDRDVLIRRVVLRRGRRSTCRLIVPGLLADRLGAPAGRRVLACGLIGCVLVPGCRGGCRAVDLRDGPRRVPRTQHVHRDVLVRGLRLGRRGARVRRLLATGALRYRLRAARRIGRECRFCP